MSMDQVKADILRRSAKIRFTSAGNYTGDTPKKDRPTSVGGDSAVPDKETVFDPDQKYSEFA